MLFGHQNDDTQQSAPVVNDSDEPTDSDTNPLAVDPATGISLPVAPEELEHNGNHTEPAAEEPREEVSEPDLIVPSASTNDDESDNTTDVPPTSDAASSDTPSASTSPANDLLTPSGDDDLLNLKQQALQHLTPLVGHLDQSPEEKFRTTMMMIQSSDNQALIKDAYAAAQQISDEKVRAQALLDIVNEINYFTQQQS